MNDKSWEDIFILFVLETFIILFLNPFTWMNNRTNHFNIPNFQNIYRSFTKNIFLLFKALIWGYFSLNCFVISCICHCLYQIDDFFTLPSSTNQNKSKFVTLHNFFNALEHICNYESHLANRLNLWWLMIFVRLIDLFFQQTLLRF